MIWLTNCKTYASPPIYHLMKRFYPKETWASQGKKNSKKPRLIGVLKRRRPDLNRCIRVLQTHALPLGYCALINCMHASTHL